MAESFFFPPKQTASLDPIMLLSGPPSCGKTSLLFQFAFNSCLEKSGNIVVFICNKQRLERKPPFLAQGVDPSSEVFRQVHMKYVDDYEGVKKYFAAFHIHGTYPSAVIIDDFGDLFDDRSCQLRYGNARGRELAVSRTLAVCHETIKQMNGSLHPDRTCKLLLSDTFQGDGPRLLFMYKRWIPCIFVVTGDDMGSFTLKMTSRSSSPSGSKSNRSAKYSIALQHLALENIIEE